VRGYDVDIDAAVALLEQSDDHRVLKRMIERSEYNVSDGTETKLGIILDVETTGLNPDTDEIIELAMLPFHFSSDGRIFEVLDAFDQLQEPTSGKVPPEITRITGITTEMVQGQSIDAQMVVDMVSPAALIIAHNAEFDRKFVEKTFPVFTTKAWACSMKQISWKEEMFEGVKLEYLAMKSGFFYNPHRAEVDCRATLELLSRSLPQSGELALATLLQNARKFTCRVWAENAPFDFKDILKTRGYRWNAGNNGKPRSWYKDVSEDDLADELAYLQSDIYQRETDIPITRIGPFDRFSDRV